jgi:hypothetical protein
MESQEVLNAITELEEFLIAYPQLRPMQAEINRRLAQFEGEPLKRLAVIVDFFEWALLESPIPEMKNLSKQWRKLAISLREMDIEEDQEIG